MLNRTVTVYSASWCAFCHMAKRYLESKGVDYTEIDVEHDRNAAHELVAKTGQAGIPVIEIGDNIIVGFDRMTIDESLKKYNLVKD